MIMKRLTFIMITFLVFSPAYAFIIRLNTLGNIADYPGAALYKDDSTIFYNPAEVSRIQKNFIHFQESMGGVFKKSGNGRFTYGVHYGKQSPEYSDILNSLDSFVSANSSANKPVRLFWAYRAKKMSFGIGQMLAYARGKSIGRSRREYIEVARTDIGIDHDKFSLWANILEHHEGRDSSVTTQQGYDGEIGIRSGVKTQFFGLTQFMSYELKKYTKGVPFGAALPLTQGINTKVKITKYIAGLGDTLRLLNNTLSIYYGYAFNYEKTEENANGYVGENTQIKIPFQVAFEYKLFSWLKLRSGAVYNIYDIERDKQNKSLNVDNKSSISGPEIGGTLSYSIVDVDFRYIANFDQSSSGINNLGEVGIRVSW